MSITAPSITPLNDVAEREVIDARGSIDSRTFDAEGRVSSVVKDGRDGRDPAVDVGVGQTHWRSKAGQGFPNAPVSRIGHGSSRRKGFAKPRISLATQSRVSRNILSGSGELWQSQRRLSDIPLFFKITIPIIVILLVVVIFLALS